MQRCQLILPKRLQRAAEHGLQGQVTPEPYDQIQHQVEGCCVSRARHDRASGSDQRRAHHSRARGGRLSQPHSLEVCCRASISRDASQNPRLWTPAPWRSLRGSSGASSCSAPPCARRLMPSPQTQVGPPPAGKAPGSGKFTSQSRSWHWSDLVWPHTEDRERVRAGSSPAWGCPAGLRI